MNVKPYCLDCLRDLIRISYRNSTEIRRRLKPHEAIHEARGLCECCYRSHRHAGTLDQFPRSYGHDRDRWEDWQELKSHGYTMKTAAERLGITEKALQKAVRRYQLKLEREDT